MPQRLLAWRAYTEAASYLQRGQTQQALDSLDRSLTYHPSFVQVLCMQARLFLEQRSFPLARQALAKALLVRPNAACALSLRGKIREELHDRKGALSDYSLALKGQVSRLWGPTSIMHYWLYRHRAQLYLSEQRYKAAAAEISQALRIRLQPLKLVKLRGKCRLQSGQPKRAVQDFLRYLKSKPYDDQSHYLLGLAYHRIGRHKQALKSLKRALQLHPERDQRRAMFYYARSVVYMEKGKLRMAQKDATQAIWSWSSFAPAYGMRSMIAMAQREFRWAIIDCQILLKLNPKLSGYASVCRLLVLAVQGDKQSFLRAYKSWRKLRAQRLKQSSFGWKLVKVPTVPMSFQQFLQTKTTTKATSRPRK